MMACCHGWMSGTCVSIIRKDAIVLMRENVLLGTTQTFDAGHPLFIGYRPVPSVHGRFMTDRRCFR